MGKLGTFQSEIGRTEEVARVLSQQALTTAQAASGKFPPPIFFASLATTPAPASGLGATQLAGFSAVGDGGGGFFDYAAISPGSNDGGTTVNISGGAAWVRRDANGTLWNCRWFGAKGDGVTDDTNAIMLAEAALERSGTGGTLLFPLGTYLVRPNVLKILQNAIRWQGITNGGTSPSPGVRNGARLVCNGLGTIVSGPIYNGALSVQANNIYNCRISDLGLEWSSGVTGGIIGQCKALDFSGFNQSSFERIAIALPVSSPAYGFYGTSKYDRVGGHSAQGTYWDAFWNCTVIGSNSVNSKGHYWAFLLASNSGVNSCSIHGGNVSVVDVGYHLDGCYGCSIFGADAEACITNALVLGGAGINQDTIGCTIYMHHIEMVTGTYPVKFLLGANRNLVSIGSYGTFTGVGQSGSGLVDPASIDADNVVEWGGQRYGHQRVYPVVTQTTGAYQGSMSGQMAVQIPALGPLGYSDPTLATLPQVAAVILRLNKLLRGTGGSEPYSPQDESAPMVSYWRASYGIIRTAGVGLDAVGPWRDILNDTSLASSGATAAKYEDYRFDGTLPAPMSDGPTQCRPYTKFVGVPGVSGGRLSATLPSTITSGTIVVIAAYQGPASGSNFQTIFELAPANTVNTGIRFGFDEASGLFLASRLGVALASSPYNVSAFFWSFYAISFDGTHTKLYVNSNTPVSTDTSAQALSAMGHLMLGDYVDSSGNSYLTGGIAEAMVFSSVLSDGPNSNINNLLLYSQQNYSIQVHVV